MEWLLGIGLILMIIGWKDYMKPNKEDVQDMNSVRHNDEMDMCTRDTLNRLDNACSCNVWVKGSTTLVSVNRTCPEHGCDDTVEQTDGASHTSDDADFTCA